MPWEKGFTINPRGYKKKAPDHKKVVCYSMIKVLKNSNISNLTNVNDDFPVNN